MGELQTCRYSHGKCKLPRATKKNGTLHTLCEYHRTKACAHQKKLDAKRRNEKLKMFQDDPSLRPGRKQLKPPSPSWHDVVENENRPPNHTRYVWDHQPAQPVSPTFLKPPFPHQSYAHHPSVGYTSYAPPPTYAPQSSISPREHYDNGYEDPRYNEPPKYTTSTSYGVRSFPPRKVESEYGFPPRPREYSPASYAPATTAMYAPEREMISPRYEYYESHEVEPVYSRWGPQPVAYHS